jgi:hypothetical protein
VTTVFSDYNPSSPARLRGPIARVLQPVTTDYCFVQVFHVPGVSIVDDAADEASEMVADEADRCSLPACQLLFS